jgi:hypothetical protein
MSLQLQQQSFSPGQTDSHGLALFESFSKEEKKNLKCDNE